MSLVGGLQSRTSRARLDRSRDQSLARQVDMFRLACRDHDLTLARLAALTGFHPKTLGKWAKGESAMDLWAFTEVAKHIPDHLSSLMLEPACKGLYSLEEGEGCYDELAQLSLEYSMEHLEARTGSDHPRLREKLRERARRMWGAAARIVRRGQ